MGSVVRLVNRPRFFALAGVVQLAVEIPPAASFPSVACNREALIRVKFGSGWGGTGGIPGWPGAGGVSGNSWGAGGIAMEGDDGYVGGMEGLGVSTAPG